MTALRDLATAALAFLALAALDEALNTARPLVRDPKTGDLIPSLRGRLTPRSAPS